jgi:hypothetical protein
VLWFVKIRVCLLLKNIFYFSLLITKMLSKNKGLSYPLFSIFKICIGNNENNKSFTVSYANLWKHNKVKSFTIASLLRTGFPVIAFTLDLKLLKI